MNCLFEGTIKEFLKTELLIDFDNKKVSILIPKGKEGF